MNPAFVTYTARLPLLGCSKSDYAAFNPDYVKDNFLKGLITFCLYLINQILSFVLKPKQNYKSYNKIFSVKDGAFLIRGYFGAVYDYA